MALKVWLPLTSLDTNQNLGVSTTVPVFNGCTVDDSGKIGQCVSLTTGNYIGLDAANVNNHKYPQLTVAIWGYCTQNDSTERYFVDCYQGGGAGIHWMNQKATWQIYVNGSYYQVTSDTIPLNEWHHFCGTYDGETMEFYVDGVSVGTTSVSGSISYNATTPWALAANPGSGSFGSGTWVGKYNDLRIYDEAISAKQVKEISQALILHYKLDEIVNKNLVINGFGESGTFNWNKTTTSDYSTDVPSSDTSIKLSYKNDNRTVELIPILPSHSYYISCWVKADSTSSCYPSILPYDVDGKLIQNYHCADGFISGTTTILAQAINPGDTVIYATDLSGWNTASGQYGNFCAIFGYKDSTGRVYPDLQYTQDLGTFGSGTNEKTNINKTNNTITLITAYTGAAHPAGTTICQSKQGSAYYYPFGGISYSTISDWTKKETTLVPANINRIKYSAYWRFQCYNGSLYAGITIKDSSEPHWVVDSSGYGNHGTIVGELERVDTSLFNSKNSSRISNRYRFASYTDSGVNSRIVTPKLYLADKAITMSVWFKSINATPTGNYHMLVDSVANRQWYEMCIYKTGYFRSGLVINGTRSVANATTGVSSALLDGNWHMVTITYNGSSVCRYVDGQPGSAVLILNGGSTSGPTALSLLRDGPDGTYAADECSLSDFRIYKTGFGDDDVLDLYRSSANIDNLAGVHSFEFIENDNSSVGENGIFESKVYDEMVELSDGSLWLPICYHYINGGANLFKSTDDFTYPVFDSPDVWANFPIIDTVLRPESGYYEFLVKQQNNLNGPWSTYRFKQTVNPLTATYSTAGPSSGNITWIEGGSSSYGGMYKLNSPTATSSNYMCFSNGSNGNWFGCGCKQAYNGGIPSICNTVPKGVQVVYIRVSSTMAQKYEMGLTNSRELIEK